MPVKGIASLIFVLGFLGLCAWIFLPNSWTNVIWYSWTNAIWYGVQYSVPFDQVHTSNKPSDCDWRRAPLGRKGCHYKATVQGFNAAGNLVAGEYAPKYGNDVRTGKPIVSSDGGKTWIWSLADAIPDRTVKTIRVEWVKVTE
jgi:hypothetical protein